VTTKVPYLFASVCAFTVKTATGPGATGDKEAPPEQADYASAATGALAQAVARVARLAWWSAWWRAQWRNMAA